MTNEPEVEHKQKKLSRWKILLVVLLFVILIPSLAFFVGRWIDTVFGLPTFPPFPFNLIVGAVVIPSGVVLAWAAIFQLYRAGLGLPWGDVDAPAQSTQLVTTGVYAYTRNPMVLGFLIMLSGIGWVAQSIIAIILNPAVAFILLWIWLKQREEPRLEQRFGDAYRAYKKTTPLIIPRLWRRAKKGE
ncbi:MAG: methyltransferase family protein [Candidatus Thorarchaeota archaeon]